jgi:hypothetical protein
VGQDEGGEQPAQGQGQVVLLVKGQGQELVHLAARALLAPVLFPKGQKAQDPSLHL